MERAYVSTALVRRDKTLIGLVSTEITRKRPPQRHNPDGLSLATPKRKRTYNIRRIKATWPYSVQEIAELFGIHKNAVLRWLQDGLQANRDQRPFLIRGAELARFLTARQTSKRRKCSTTEFTASSAVTRAKPICASLTWPSRVPPGCGSRHCAQCAALRSTRCRAFATWRKSKYTSTSSN